MGEGGKIGSREEGKRKVGGGGGGGGTQNSFLGNSYFPCSIRCLNTIESSSRLSLTVIADECWNSPSLSSAPASSSMVRFSREREEALGVILLEGVPLSVLVVFSALDIVGRWSLVHVAAAGARRGAFS